MNRYLLIALILAFCAGNAAGQEILLERVDVGPDREGIVTAKYLFGVNVVIKNQERVSEVAFTLRWTQGNYIKYSGHKLINLGDYATAHVVTTEDIIANEGAAHVGITSSETFYAYGYDDPEVIYLEFAVLRNAPNNEIATFWFERAEANINNDTERVKIDLSQTASEFRIHGYTDVWPGDTDNDGIANEFDVLPIGLYFDYGSEVKKIRSFKRESASALWHAQKALAWDVMEATYADCDGNGVVNEADVLIITVNNFKTHSLFNKKTPEIQSAIEYTPLANENTVSIPIYGNFLNPVLSYAGRIETDGLTDGVEILGIDNGSVFPDDKCIIFTKVRDGAVHFAALGQNGITGKSGEIAKLIINPNGKNLNSFEFNIASLKAVNHYGMIEPAGFPTSVETDSHVKSHSQAKYNDGILSLAPPFVNGNVKIFNSYGALVYSGSLNSNEIELSLNAGAYYGFIRQNNGSLSRFRFLAID